MFWDLAQQLLQPGSIYTTNVNLPAFLDGLLLGRVNLACVDSVPVKACKSSDPGGVFRPANGYCEHRLLVKIIFLVDFSLQNCKLVRNSEQIFRPCSNVKVHWCKIISVMF